MPHAVCRCSAALSAQVVGRVIAAHRDDLHAIWSHRQTPPSGALLCESMRVREHARARACSREHALARAGARESMRACESMRAFDSMRACESMRGREHALARACACESMRGREHARVREHALVRACARESMRVREHARVSAPLHLGTATQVQPQGYGGGRVSERASKCVSERASTECDSSTCCWFGEPTDSGGISGHSGEGDGRAVPSSHVRVFAR